MHLIQFKKRGLFQSNIGIEPTLTEKQKYIQRNVVQLFKDLKEQIYPVLDEFVVKAEICLLDHFDCLDIPFDITTIRSLLVLTQDSINPTLVEWIERVLGEITYAQKMKQLENFAEKTEKDVVPISGLIVGRIMRLENELQTVLEVWDQVPPQGHGIDEQKTI